MVPWSTLQQSWQNHTETVPPSRPRSSTVETPGCWWRLPLEGTRKYQKAWTIQSHEWQRPKVSTHFEGTINMHSEKSRLATSGTSDVTKDTLRNLPRSLVAWRKWNLLFFLRELHDTLSRSCRKRSCAFGRFNQGCTISLRVLWRSFRARLADSREPPPVSQWHVSAWPCTLLLRPCTFLTAKKLVRSVTLALHRSLLTEPTHRANGALWRNFPYLVALWISTVYPVASRNFLPDSIEYHSTVSHIVCAASSADNHFRHSLQIRREGTWPALVQQTHVRLLLLPSKVTATNPHFSATLLRWTHLRSSSQNERPTALAQKSTTSSFSVGAANVADFST